MREITLKDERPSAPEFRPPYHIVIIEKACYGAECGIARAKAISTQMNSMGQFRPGAFGFGRRLRILTLTPLERGKNYGERHSGFSPRVLPYVLRSGNHNSG
jgi:hypothetical protein